MKLAILDDYQGLALKSADWQRLKGVEISVFDKPFSSQAEAANSGAHIVGAADEADHPLDLDAAAGFFFGAFLFVSHWCSLLRQPFADGR